MIISSISCGQWKIVLCVVHASGDTFPSRRLTSVLLRCQTVAMQAERLIPMVHRRGQGEIRGPLDEQYPTAMALDLLGDLHLLSLGISSWWT